MNILILTTHLNPGGISRYVLNLAKGLKNRGSNVWVANCGGEWVLKLKELGIGYKFIYINTKSIVSFKILISFFMLLSLVLNKKIQLIHANTRVTQFLGFLIYKFLKIPYVSTFHGFYRASFFRRHFKFCGLRTIAISKAVKEHLIRDLKIKEENIRVIYNGTDIEDFLIKKRSKEDFGFSQKDFIIGILGRISQEKGHFLAVEAFSLLVKEYKNIFLLINGRGKLERKLKLFIESLGLTDRVKFIQHLESREFLDILDLLIVASKKEGFGFTIIEAFIKNVAVIGYNTGGIREIIKDRENGLLFYEYNSLSLKRAIEELILDKALYEKIVEKAKLNVDYFSLERMVNETLLVYNEILGKIKK
ncbi:MAG: glycosyltransferase family 4 protein [Candidatus Aenigmatarchaeota archaeon]